MILIWRGRYSFKRDEYRLWWLILEITINHWKWYSITGDHNQPLGMIISLIQQFNSGFKFEGRCKKLLVYGLTETSVKFQTISFQYQLPSAHQKWAEIGDLFAYTCSPKRKFHPSVHTFRCLFQWKKLLG
jgi:hypothetical protein